VNFHPWVVSQIGTLSVDQLDALQAVLAGIGMEAQLSIGRGNNEESALHVREAIGKIRRDFKDMAEKGRQSLAQGEQK